MPVLPRLSALQPRCLPLPLETPHGACLQAQVIPIDGKTLFLSPVSPLQLLPLIRELTSPMVHTLHAGCMASVSSCGCVTDVPPQPASKLSVRLAPTPDTVPGT